MSRIANDFYPTPEWLTEAIMPVLAQRMPRMWSAMSILEPACGNGAIVSVVRRRFHPAVIRGFDIAGETGVDFLREAPRPLFDLIITNPPYSLAQPFVEQALKWRRDDKSVVAMLLRLGFLGSQRRASFLREHTPSVYISPRRPSFATNKDGKTGSDNSEYAWFLWQEGVKPTIGILPTEEVQ